MTDTLLLRQTLWNEIRVPGLSLSTASLLRLFPETLLLPILMVQRLWADVAGSAVRESHHNQSEPSSRVTISGQWWRWSVDTREEWGLWITVSSPHPHPHHDDHWYCNKDFILLWKNLLTAHNWEEPRINLGYTKLRDSGSSVLHKIYGGWFIFFILHIYIQHIIWLFT